MSIFKTFKDVDDLKDEEKMIQKLHDLVKQHRYIKEILSYTFDENIVWLLPETDPPYKPSTDRVDKMEPRLLQELKSLPIFLNIGKYPNMVASKRQQIFIDVLNTISTDDAVFLLSIKNRKLPFENLTKEIVEKAFPSLAEKWKNRNLPVDKNK